MIILATKSPYRIERFKELGLEFISESSEVDEYHEGRPTQPEELVKYLAKLKAEAVAKKHSAGIIIGFDSVAYFEGKIIEKPKSRQEAFERLRIFSGKKHEFYTGIHIINLDNKKTLTDFVETNVLMRDLSEVEINDYLNQDPNFHTYALGYDPLGHRSFSFVRSIKGSYNNLLSGLPVERIVEMLKEIGYKD